MIVLIIFVMALFLISGVSAIFWYAKYQFRNNDYEEVLKELKEKNSLYLKQKTFFVIVKDQIDSYKHKKNPYTALKEISDTLINMEKKDISPTKNNANI